MSGKHLEDMLKMTWRHFCKTPWRRLTYWSRPRYLEDVLNTSSEDVKLRRIYSSWSRRLLKMKTKDVFKTSSSRRMFAGTTYKTLLYKNQTKPQKQIKLKVAVESKSYYLKILSGTDNNWSRQIKYRYRNYERCSFQKSATRGVL